MNALLDDWTTPFGLPPFDRIGDEDWTPAVDAALAEARARIAAIAAEPEPPSFANTLAALEAADRRLGRILAAFWAVAGADANPAREAIERDLAPKLAAFGSEIIANKALYARIEALWQGRAALALSPEEARVLELAQRRFVRAGARLEGEAAARMAAIKERLAVLGTRFAQNLLAEERGWALPLDEAGLAGLPGFVVAALRAAGEARGAPGPVVTLSRSLIVPFLQHSPRRDLRRRAWEAWVARGANGGATDNRAVAAEMLALRHEKARLLGYPDYAHWKLETEMARAPDAVRELLMAVWGPARAATERDRAALELRLGADGLAPPIEPWDWRYYAERLREQDHGFDEASVKPFFPLDGMLAAAFAVAGRLFGLEFRPADGPTYHPDVRLWEVTRAGEHRALYLFDPFARAGKRSGAWCGALRRQAGAQRPIVTNICNFARPPAGAAALLSWDDARTLFHEFGHALHHILSEVGFESLSGTAVARDFVELPSQLFEHWLEVPEVLSDFARHAETGAAMPETLRARLLAARTHDMGAQTVEYLASACVDLDAHTGEPPPDPMQRQAEVLARLGMPQGVAMRHATPHFQHVFGGDGYAAGYYSYLWSEVMDADAFAAFEEAGDPFDPALAARLESEILRLGGSRDERDSWLAFRGREPEVEALLRGRALGPAAA
jgi:peptidyl-dipeptidase Dcp